MFSQLSGEEEDFNSKEAQLLVSILTVLSRQLEPSSQQVSIPYVHFKTTDSVVLLTHIYICSLFR